MPDPRRIDIGLGKMPGERATERGHFPNHPLASIRPVTNRANWRLESARHSAFRIGAWLPDISDAGNHATNYSTGSGVLDQNPGHRPTVVGRHHVVLSDRSPCSRTACNLPDPTLGTPFTRAGRCAERLARHVWPSFPPCGGLWRDATMLIDKEPLGKLIIDTEPKGSLFAARCVPWRSARPAKALQRLGWFSFTRRD
jgi:hypothetical protein